MLFDYAGHPVTQERIVATAYGGILNLPAQPQTILAALNIAWQDDNGQLFNPSARVVDLATATNELAANRPLIVGTLGHAMLITAMDYRMSTGIWVVDRLIVRGPFPYGPATGTWPPPGLGANGGVR